MNRFSWQPFLQVPLIGILRGFDRRLLPGIIRAAIAGGLTSIEVTLNSPNAADQIRDATQLANGRLNIGAGTVLTLDLLEQALEAGASFIVTPSLNEAVLDKCIQASTPIFPGVFSPTEMAQAADRGASWFKFFPSDALAPACIAEIKAALPHLKLLPTGGITLDTLPELVAAGADGFGIGSPLFNPERIRAEDWPWLEDRCRTFVSLFQTSRRTCRPPWQSRPGLGPA